MQLDQGFVLFMLQCAILVAMPCYAAAQGTSGSSGGAIDGGVKVGFGIFNHDVGYARNDEMNLAAFICATTGTIDIGEANQNSLYLVGSCI